MPVKFIIPRLTLLALVIIVLLLGVGLWVFIYLPRARVTVYPKTTDETVTAALTLSGQTDAPDFKRFIVPAKLIDKTIEEQNVITREGADVHDDFARGKVTLVNDQEEEQPLLPKTHLKHEGSGVYFLTDTAVTVPPKNKVEIAVTAKEKGSSGNVTAGKFIIDRLPLSLQQVVYAESKQPFTGGVATDKPVTEQEINTAKQDTLEAARKRLLGEITAEAKGARVREDLLTVKTEQESVSAAPGSAAQTFTVLTRLRGQAFVADENDLLSMTVLSLQTKANKDTELTTYNPASFLIKIQRIDIDRKEAYVEGTVTGTFSARLGNTVFSANNLAGRTQSEVEEYFQQFPGIDHIEVNFSLPWMKTIPSRAGSTEIVVKNAK